MIWTAVSHFFTGTDEPRCLTSLLAPMNPGVSLLYWHRYLQIFTSVLSAPDVWMCAGHCVEGSGWRNREGAEERQGQLKTATRLTLSAQQKPADDVTPVDNSSTTFFADKHTSVFNCFLPNIRTVPVIVSLSWEKISSDVNESISHYVIISLQPTCRSLVMY